MSDLAINGARCAPMRSSLRAPLRAARAGFALIFSAHGARSAHEQLRQFGLLAGVTNAGRQPGAHLRCSALPSYGD
jgi:hypothetical protein